MPFKIITSREKLILLFGLILILSSLVFNKWFIAAKFGYDGSIDSLKFNSIIILFQLVLLVAGAFLVIKRRSLKLPSKTEIVLVATSLFLCEVVARIWLDNAESLWSKYALYSDIPPEKLRYTKHHYLNYSLTPKFNNGLTYHNSLGYRDEEFSLKALKDEFRIVVIGGSTVYSSGVKDNKKTFTSQLEEILKNKYNHEHVNVINGGVPGYNSWETLINLEFRILDLNPDLIIVYHGTNDVHTRLVSENTFTGDNSGRRKQWELPEVSVLESSVILRIIARGLGITRQVGIADFTNAPSYYGAGSLNYLNAKNEVLEEMYNSNSSSYFKRNLKNMIAITRTQGVEIALATWAHSPLFQNYVKRPIYQQGFKDHNQVVLSLAREENIPVYDFASEMPVDKKFWRDGRHVTDEGAVVKAELFGKFLHNSNLIP